MNGNLPDGDFTNYDIGKIIEDQGKYCIIGNPPYFLWNRIMSITSDYPSKYSDDCPPVNTENYVGLLAITSEARLPNHPGAIIRAVMPGEDFQPAVDSPQYIIQQGFEGRYHPEKSKIEGKYAPAGFTEKVVGVPQAYVGINNRDPKADKTDYYPGMW